MNRKGAKDTKAPSGKGALLYRDALGAVVAKKLCLMRNCHLL